MINGGPSFSTLGGEACELQVWRKAIYLGEATGVPVDLDVEASQAIPVDPRRERL